MNEIVIKSEAVITILGEDGLSKDTLLSKRSTTSILTTLTEAVKKDEKLMEASVRVTVDYEKPEADGTCKNLLLIEGKCSDVGRYLIQGAPQGVRKLRIDEEGAEEKWGLFQIDKEGEVTPWTVVKGEPSMWGVVMNQQAVAELQRHCDHLASHSDLKGIIITTVFGKALAGGFGYLSSMVDVTTDDMVALGEAAGAQAQQYKETMQEKHPELKFPSDAPKLILPGRFNASGGGGIVR